MRRSRRLQCRKTVELVTDYLEGALAPGIRARFEDHLRACPTCTAYLRQVETMVRALRRLAAPAPDVRAIDDLVTSYRHWILTG